MQPILAFFFWFSLTGLAYIYIGYPVAVWLAGRLRSRPIRKQFRPHAVSVVLVVHNEAAHILRKLDNLLSMENAEQIREILVGSDGSDDATTALVNACGDPRVRLIHFPCRRGKPAVLNDLVPMSTGDIVLFADARQEFEKRCLTELLANFADPAVGVVSGELVLRASPSATTAAEGIGLYWKYEKWIRKAESQCRGVPGATGACYAIRRELFRSISESTLLDDVAIPMQIAAQGYRCVFEPRAIAFDTPSSSPRQEALRKRRTIAGAAQLVRLYPHWFLGRHPLQWELVSHKVLRLCSPVLLIVAFAASGLLIAVPVYRVLLVTQAACYAAALCGWCYQWRGRRSVLFGPFLMFVTLNGTTLSALWDAVLSRYQVAWRKAAS